MEIYCENIDSLSEVKPRWKITRHFSPEIQIDRQNTKLYTMENIYLCNDQFVCDCCFFFKLGKMKSKNCEWKAKGQLYFYLLLYTVFYSNDISLKICQYFHLYLLLI